MQALREPRAADWALAVPFLMVSLLQVLLDPITARPAGVLVAVVATAPLAWRRLHPGAACVVGTSAWLVPTPQGYLFAAFVVAIVLYFSLGLHAKGVLVPAGATVWGLTCGMAATFRNGEPPETAATVAFIVVAPVLAGRVAAGYRGRALALAELGARQEAERVAVERLAVAQERARIAQELHDAVGHDVTVIAVQADAAAAALAVDPLRAAEPIGAIQAVTRRAMGEIRQLVADDLFPVDRPDLDREIGSLVERAQALGEEVRLVEVGERGALAPATHHAVYRIVQESLTNARRHAPGQPVRLRLDWGGVDVHASNPLPSSSEAPARRAGSGVGISGLRERARFVGGTLRAQADGGRFVVEAHLPRSAPR